ncbi:hypothetical protein OQH61_08700 [Helicobacter sp. MIT 21-1697]|uniref:phage protease n=1 Tax=Helicobacter sp. MIT 21-1697 TaxID=2993733 RepID=UPI00224A8C58|nr:phage protease [Helicobacter sp. MIT 21-1697]MCX2717809.1 hypothetical protein [Helicobacter sp. MIT 21-1697]
MKDIICLYECNKIGSGEKVKISPSGEFVGIDGRKYSLDAAKVIQNTATLGVDLMLDKNHEDKEAMGWFDCKSLEEREDGIYASLELNSAGESLVRDKIYRYLSPAYAKGKLSDGVCEVVRIASVGLVNRPNVLKEALNKEKEGAEVGLTPSEQEIQMREQGEKMNEQEIKALQEEIKALKAQNEALVAEIKALTEEKGALEHNAIKERVENAIKNGEMLPSRKESALALNKESLDSYLEIAKSEAQNVLKNKSLNLSVQGEQEQIDEGVKAQLGI